MKQPTIQCPTCQGGGKTELPEHLNETFWMIPRKGETAVGLHARFPEISAGSFSNRLSGLLALKLVTRKREGKFWRYSRA